ncbi:sarcosine oxidase subunit gamma [Frigidibacter sp. RF13]|uniref:sarcosine oxidase subunit gamma n=1 Tax=Frigidibacter sp. RF13 TaxID=2997340 RepID=UPI002270A9F6|nr:sarcosine oxidase subunit gamma [Frigidibacter sp. RF13]MCY1128679.1 sarcosine oxidase subunit gamma [Frigidibacter sp. RF13]
MADTLHALTPLGRPDPVSRDIGPYRIVERFDVALASVACRRGRHKDFAKAAKGMVPLPDPAHSAQGAPYSSFWVAPDMWFVEAPFATHEDIASELKQLFGDSASVTEQTDGWVRFDLQAHDLAPLLERLCNVDFPQVADGFASRTLIEHIGCYLIRRGPGEGTLYGPRSSAKSLLHVLETAAASVI